MNSKELKRLNRADLLEVIYRLQLRERALAEESAQWKAMADERFVQLNRAEETAHAALAIHDILTSAQKLADTYALRETPYPAAETECSKESIQEISFTAKSLEEFLTALDENSQQFTALRQQLADLTQAYYQAVSCYLAKVSAVQTMLSKELAYELENQSCETSF